MSKRNAIKYVQNDEPAFIRQFKQKIGYKEGPNVDTKRQKLEYDDDEDEDRSDTEEEKPVVVVLKPGDLTAEEASEADQLQKKVEEEAAIRDGKITFKKPVKKTEGTPSEEPAPDSAPKPAKDKGKSKDKDKKKKDKEQKKAHSLLSFGDEEEEEEG
ncbi:uncharacterized protein KIAA1143 homolog [Babylonia areolata]|uniref:uncharacterized protein KIAA1143 homolog n=1 Tax=Babylonia areolata TaxID=304850 RepID=UPI003FD22630